MTDFDRIGAVLRYEVDTGKLFWRVRSSVRIMVGAEAGSIGRQGYRVIRIGGRIYQAHRLAWLLTNGDWPEHDIDHKNGDRADNRIVNLRDVTRSENNQNQRRARSNNRSSGLLGVTWFDRDRRWMAQIKINGSSKNLGYFDSALEAHSAYIEAKRRLHPACTI